MAFLKQLSEKLEAQRIYDGMTGKYETRFKVEGQEYAFLANTIAGNGSEDFNTWMLEFENTLSHRIGMGDSNPKIAKSFAEALDIFIKDRNPFSFFTYGSTIQPIKSILEAIKKKVKKYNLVDDTADRKNEENGEVIPGNEIGKITWTKMVPVEVVDTQDRESLVSDKFEKTYEEPKDIKPKKDYMSGTKKSDKLEKGDNSYELKTENVKQVSYYVNKFKDKMNGSTEKTAMGWVDGLKELSDEEKKEIKKKIKPFIKKESLSFNKFKAEKFGVIESNKILKEALKADELMKKSKSVLKKFKEKFGEPFKKAIEVASNPESLKTWMDQNKEDVIAAIEIVKHMVDKKELSFEEEILKGVHINESILDVFAKKTPNALIAAAIILMASGAGNRSFAKNNAEDAFKKAKENIEKVVEIVKKETGDFKKDLEKSANNMQDKKNKAGEELDKDIDKVKELGGKVKDKAKEFGDKAKQFGDVTKKEIEKNIPSKDEVKDKAKEFGDKAKDKAKEFGDKAKDKAKEVKKGFQNFIQKKKNPVFSAPKPNTMEI